MAGKPRVKIDFNKIYNSNSCGQFKIIEDMGRDDRSRLYVKIKFINSGTEKIIRYDLAMAGKALDDLYNIDFNKIYSSIYYGPFKIIKYIGRNSESKRIVRIKFLNTGFEYDVLLRFALKGQVKDYSINYNERYIDKSVSISTYDENIINILHTRWNGMMQRCYNKNSAKYNDYGGIGVTIDPVWHNFDNYLSDILLVENFNKFYNNPVLYDLDKDYYQQHLPKNQRSYGPGKCIFLSIYDNSNLAIKEKHNDDSFYGVKILGNGNFLVEFSIDGSKYNFGVYNNIIAAANAYNYYYKKYSKAEFIQLLNDNVEFMPMDEVNKYLVKQV